MSVVIRTCKSNPGHFPTKPHEIQVPGNTAFCTPLRFSSEQLLLDNMAKQYRSRIIPTPTFNYTADTI